jgi:hypothetical protein
MRPTAWSTSRPSASTGSSPSRRASARSVPRAWPRVPPTTCTTGPARSSASLPRRAHTPPGLPPTRLAGDQQSCLLMSRFGRARSPRAQKRAAPTGGSFNEDRRRPTLPGGCPPSTIGAERLNGSVRNGKRCFPLAISPPKGFETASVELENRTRPGEKQENPSSPRPISTGLLIALLRLHSRPINLVVYQGSYSLKGMGELISRLASRLDAFSGYPVRT